MNLLVQIVKSIRRKKKSKRKHEKWKCPKHKVMIFSHMKDFQQIFVKFTKIIICFS